MRKSVLRWLCALLAAGIMTAGLPTAALAEDPTPAPTPVTEPETTPVAEPEATPVVSTPALPGPPVIQTSETALTDEEIAAMTEGLLTPMDDEGGIMLLSSPDHDDAAILALIASQLQTANNSQYWDAFEHATGISYNSGAHTASGTVKWSTTPATGCSAPWNGDKVAVTPDSSGVYHITTAEELAWVMNQFNLATGYLQARAVLDNDIDLNGQNYYWSPGNMNKGGQFLDGQGHTIYNLCVNKSTSNAGFVTQVGSTSTINNLTFDGGYIISTGNYVGAIAQIATPNGFSTSPKTFSNLHAKNLVVCSTGQQMGALFGRIEQQGGELRTTLNNCTAQDCTVLGKDHAGSLTACVLDTNASYCYSTGCTVISYGIHSGGLFSCAGGTTNFENCFTDVRLYGSTQTGVFIGGVNGTPTFRNCAASGFVDGNKLIGGFAGALEKNGTAITHATFTNCYTTALVGVNSDETASLMGGFIGGIGAATNGAVVTQGGVYGDFTNCYAAGEVGNVHTKMKSREDMENLTKTDYTNGGFVGKIALLRENSENAAGNDPSSFNKCYYDMQTTAMREQQLGHYTGTDGRTDKTFPKGVLTTDSQKSGTGLAGTTIGAEGFTGFTDGESTKWDVTLAQHYPELKEFSDAQVDTTGKTGWISQDMANTAKAFSLSSTSTVLLDTWDYALNTDMGEMYKATDTAANKTLPATTYCTVRDLTSAFPLTIAGAELASDEKRWITVATAYGETEQHAQAAVTGSPNVLTIQHNKDGTYICDEFAPGMEWLLVSNTVGGQTVTRHVRVTPTAAIEAGASKMVTTDEAYNHRNDVKMIFSTAEKIDAATPIIKQGGYPYTDADKVTGNTGYIDVGVGTTMSVDPPTGDNATDSKLYVYLKEITGFNDTTGAIETKSIIPATDTTTTEAMAWAISVDNALDKDHTYANAFNGNDTLPNVDKRYLLTYMWQLADGRVVQDAKIIRSAKVPFTVELNVFHNMNDDTLEDFIQYKKDNDYTDDKDTKYNNYLYNSGVKTDADKDDSETLVKTFTPTFNLTTNGAHAILTGEEGDAENQGVKLHHASAVAWQLNNPTDDYIRSVTLTMDVLQSAVAETKESYSQTFTVDTDGNPLQNGSKLELEYTLYRLVYRNNTYYTVPETVKRSYTLTKSGDTYSIVFDKAGVEGDESIDPEDHYLADGGEVYFNDMEFNLRTDVVVGHKYNLFSLTKTVTGDLADPSKAFDFVGVCEVLGEGGAYTSVAAGTVLTYTLTGEDDPQTVTVGEGGKITLRLKHGQTATFINVPFDRITVKEDILATDGYITGYTTTHGTVDAESNRTPSKTGDVVDEPVTVKPSTEAKELVITRAGYTYDGTAKKYVDTAGKYVDLTFTNNREHAVPTGIREDATPFVVFGGFTLAGLALLLALAFAEECRRRSMNQ